MHARQIIQDFLARQCGWMHAKRRDSLASVIDAARRCGLGLLKMSKGLASNASLRHRIKIVDRMLSNPHLADERLSIYREVARSVIGAQTRIGLIIDWSDLLRDVSQHVLRAAVVARGRAIVIYEEIHPTKQYATKSVHRAFMQTLRTVLPDNCKPIILTDAGFRATWFKMLDELGFDWIGRIRNRDMVRANDTNIWQSCKDLYPGATSRARDLGKYEYARSNPVPCRLVLVRRTPKGRKSLTVFGKASRSRHNNKQRSGQTEPWLLAASASLAKLKARDIIDWYGTRMQIEQTFRDLKSPQQGFGLSASQTRNPKRLAILLMIAALVSLVLWLIGLAIRKTGYAIQYGSTKKASATLSILSLARHWLEENVPGSLTRHQIEEALAELRALVKQYQI